MEPVPLFHEVLKLAVENSASDIVVKSNRPAFFRLSGRLKPVDMDAITGESVTYGYDGWNRLTSASAVVKLPLASASIATSIGSFT